MGVRKRKAHERKYPAKKSKDDVCMWTVTVHIEELLIFLGYKVY